MKTKFRRSGGMTLVEVVVSLAIVVTLSVSVLSALVYAAGAQSDARQKETALLECENIINCLRADEPCAALSLMYGVEGSELSLAYLYSAADVGERVGERESFAFSFLDGVAHPYFTDGCDFYISFDVEIWSGALVLHTLRVAVNTDDGYTDAYSLDLPLMIYSKEASSDE